jgi:hypothetical protein
MSLLPLGILSQGGGAAASQWVATLASGNNEFAKGIFTDTSGNIYLSGFATAGSYQSALFARINSGASAISFQVAANTVSAAADYKASASDGTSFYAVGSQSGGNMLVKYNNSGVIQWQRLITPVANAILLSAVAVDTAGNVFIGGYSWSGAGFYHHAVAKYNSSGTFQWGYSIYTGQNNFGYAVATDSTNAVYICGQGGSGYGAMLMKLNSAGTVLQNRVFYSSATSDIIWAAVCDSGDNLIVMGTYGDTGGTFVMKLNSSSVIQWQRYVNASSAQNNSGVAVDATNAVYIVTSGSNIIKYNSSGTIQWQRSFTRTSGAANISSIRIDGSNFVITGSTTGTDIVLAKLPIDGTQTGTYVVSGASFVYAASSLTDNAGTLSGFNSGGQSGNVLNDNAGTLTATTTSLTLAKSA